MQKIRYPFKILQDVWHKMVAHVSPQKHQSRSKIIKQPRHE